jgi:hypothetical protein
LRFQVGEQEPRRHGCFATRRGEHSGFEQEIIGADDAKRNDPTSFD